MTAKARKRRSAAGTAIYVVLLVLWIVFLAAIGLYIVKQVWSYASVYDDTQPEPVIDAYMDALRENLWDDSIGATVAAMPHQVQSDAEVAELVKEMLHDELDCELDPVKTRSDSRTYNLLCGGNVFGTVTLEQDTSRNLVADVKLPSKVIGALAKIGVAIQPELYPWKLGEETFDFSGLYSSVEVTVPASYRVSLNGVNLSEEYITERDIHFDILEHYYYRYDNLPTKVTYRFDNLMGHIDPVIYDDSGNEFVIDKKRDDSQFLQQVDEQTRADIETFVDGFSDAYLRLSASTGDYNTAYAEVLKYIEAGSEMDNKLKQVFLIGDWAHNSYYQYGGSSLIGAYSIGGGCYVVDYSASATVNQPIGTVEVTRVFRSIIDASGDRMVIATIDDI